MACFQKGRRMMTAGSICLLLSAAMHTVAHFSPLPNEPQLNAVVASMEACRLDAGFGMLPSVAEIQWSLSLAMSVFLAAIGISNLVVVGHRTIPASLVRGLAAVNTLAMATLALVFYTHSFPPPLINFSILAILFFIALVLPQPDGPIGAESP